MTPLTDEDRDVLQSGHCPKCLLRGFVVGPQGGLNTNVECASITCRERYNVAFYSGNVLFAERIGNGYVDIPWPSEPEPGAPA